MLGYQGNQNTAAADSRALLLSAAKKIFAQKGYNGSTVKEIADLAGVNVSLISYHFSGKEGLFRACVEEFGRDCLRQAEEILVPATSAADLESKLLRWSEQFLEFQIKESNVCRILYQEDIFAHSFMADVFEDTFAKAFRALVQFITKAQSDGLVLAKVNPTLASSMFFGAMVHSGQTTAIQEKWFKTSIAHEEFRTSLVQEYLAILFHGISEVQQ